jgi:hypothetical protein
MRRNWVNGEFWDGVDITIAEHLANAENGFRWIGVCFDYACERVRREILKTLTNVKAAINVRINF